MHPKHASLDLQTDASGSVAVRVNVANGNLFIQSDESVIAGPGASIDVKRVYNSAGVGGGDISEKWATSVNLLGLDVRDTNAVTFYGKTGEKGTFTKSGAAYVAPAGLNATLTKDTFGPYIFTYNRTGERIIFNASGWPTADQDRNQVGVSFGYSANGKLVSVTDSTGKKTSLTYGTTSTSRLTSIRDFTGRTSTMTLFGAGELTTWDGLESVTGFRGNWTLDSTGAVGSENVTSISDGAGKTILFEYTNGRVTKVTQSKTGQANVVTSLGYTAGQTTVTDPRGNDSTYVYDPQLRVTSVTDQLGHVRAQSWTPNSDVATTTDASTTAAVTTNSYDGSNNLTKTQLPTGAAAQAFYAAGTDCPNAQSGNPYSAKCTVDAAGNKSSIEYDTAGNPTRQTDTTSTGGAVTHQYTYQSASVLCWGVAGQICSSKDGNGNTTGYVYDAGKNLASVTPPAPLGPTSYLYDALSRVTSVTDGNGHTTTYGYDVRDRITTTTYSDGSTVLTAWNADSTKKSESDSASSVVIRYAYNTTNKTTQQKFESVNTAVLADTVNMSYDANGNLSTYADAGGTVTYAYNAANKVVKLKEPNGTCPTGSAAPAAGSGCTTFAYDNNNAEIARVFPGGARVDSTIDAAGRPTRITAKDASGTAIQDVGYSYTAPGGTADRSAIQKRTSYNERGITAGAITTYSYDSLLRLTKAEEKAGSAVTASWTYGYDAAGNRTSQVKAGSGLSAANITYNYNAANQLTSTNTDTTTWTYDAVGNQTRNGITGATSTYGNRLNVTANAGQAALSFGLGNAQGLFVAGTTELLSSALGITRTTGASSNQQYYTRTPDGAALGYRNTSAQTKAYFVHDHLGSVVAVFDASGATTVRYSYSPYGELRSQSSSTAEADNDLRYIGGFKVGNLYKLGARYYDPSIGRFTQMDPSGQEANPYLYAAGNPINASDPTGLLTGWDILYGLASAIGCAFVSSVSAGILCGVLFTFGPAVADGYGDLGLLALEAAEADFCNTLLNQSGGYDICALISG